MRARIQPRVSHKKLLSGAQVLSLGRGSILVSMNIEMQARGGRRRRCILRRDIPRPDSLGAPMGKNARMLALFDVDGTLTEPRKVVSPETLDFLKALREKIAIGVVGGSDLVKQKEQLGDSPTLFDWCFAENGLLAHKDGALIGQTSLVSHLGEIRA